MITKMITKNCLSAKPAIKFSHPLLYLVFSLLLAVWPSVNEAATSGTTYTLGNIGNKTVAEGELLDFSIQLPSYFGPDVKWTVSGLPETGVFYEVPAFPGAEGFGARAGGGRGGKVVKVTNLNRDGTGSLAEALALDEPRIIVFDVSGVIESSLPKGEWLISKAGRHYTSNSPVTIAGQTAPGGGITINGELCFYDGDGGTATNDVIVRFIRLRSPYYRKNVGDNILAGGNRAVFDHLSGAWGDDENFDFSNLKNASVQWCGIEESAGAGEEWEAFTDKDADGMYDYWEEKVRDYNASDSIKDYILDILPDTDIDGDGKTNLEEYKKGSNPLVANALTSSEWTPNYDSDGDGMADWWERRAIDYSASDNLTTLADVAPKADLDGDLSSNIEEYFAGTNPLAVPSHNYGMIAGYAGKNISLHHNFFAHHSVRTPLTGVELLDERNNVIYNADLGITSHPVTMNEQRPGERFRTNILANYFKAGPNAPKLTSAITYFYPFVSATGLMINESGNYFDMIDNPHGYFSLFDTNLRKGIFFGSADQQAATMYAVPEVTTHSAELAYNLVLAHAGTVPRDQTTGRNIEEIRTRTGKWGKNVKNGSLTAGLSPTPPLVDSDSDGLPDEWETAVFSLPNGTVVNRAKVLNPSNGSDYTKIVKSGESILSFAGKSVKNTEDRYKGYTYIEYYINELADQLILKQLYDNGYDETYLPGYGKTVLPKFSWVPAYDKSGTYNVTITANDEKGHSITEKFQIFVSNTDRSTYIYPAMYTSSGAGINTLAKNSIEAGNTFTFEFYILDIDGNTYTVNIESLPSGAKFRPTGKKETSLKGDSPYDIYAFEWTPTLDDVGKYGAFTIVVTEPSGKKVMRNVPYQIIKPSKPVYIISADGNTGGTISPSGDVLVQENNKKMFSFTPDKGYTVADVFVDGVSIGAVPAHIFENVTKNHTVKVTFKYSPDSVNGLVLKLDCSGNMKDSSGLGNDGITVGGSSPQLTNDRFGIASRAYFFDGIDDYINIEDSDYFNFTEYTLSAWVYGIKDFEKLQYIISKNTRDGANATGMFTAWDSFYASAGGYPRIVNIMKDMENQWLHLAIVRKLTSVAFFINGKYLGETTTGYNEDNNLNLTIGARSGTPTPTAGFFGGALDDIRIYNHALTSSEIAIIAGTNTSAESIYTIKTLSGTGGTITPSGTIQVTKGSQQRFTFSPADGYMIADVAIDGVSIGSVNSYTFTNITDDHTLEVDFDEKPSTIDDIVEGLVLKLDFDGDMKDSSGFGYDGITALTDGPKLTNDRFGNPKDAYYFDGVNDYIQIPDSNAFNLPEYTLSMWIFGTKDFTSGQYIISKNSSDSNNAIGIFTLWNHLYASGTEYPHIEKLMTDMENTWIHLVVVKKGSSMEVFLNGVSQGAFTTGVTKSNALNLVIGARAGGVPPSFRFFKGVLDDIAIYNRALSSEEILTLTNATNN